MATAFYKRQINQHLKIGLRAMEKLRAMAPERLHSRTLRSFLETAFQSRAPLPLPCRCRHSGSHPDQPIAVSLRSRVATCVGGFAGGVGAAARPPTFVSACTFCTPPPTC